MPWPRLLSVATVAGFLTGCNFWMAGHSEDYGLILYGEGVINVENDTSTFSFTIDNSSVKCSGSTVIVDKRPEIIGSRGKATITCNDGRKGTGELVITSLEGGTGSGTDDCGNAVQLVWNIHEHKVQRLLKQHRQTASARNSAFTDKCDAASDAPPHRDPLI